MQISLKDLYPPNRYELFKLLIDVVLLIFFILSIYFNSLSYRQGFEDGLRACFINATTPKPTENFTIP